LELESLARIDYGLYERPLGSSWWLYAWWLGNTKVMTLVSCTRDDHALFPFSSGFFIDFGLKGKGFSFSNALTTLIATDSSVCFRLFGHSYILL
jgi:hypothetical protein